MTDVDARRAVMNAYPGDKWAIRVSQMGIKQIWAIYFKLKKEGRI